MFKISIQKHTVLYLSRITNNAYICTHTQFNEVIPLKMIMLSVRAIDYVEKKRLVQGMILLFDLYWTENSK